MAIQLPEVQETWLPKVDLFVDSAPYHSECQINANNDMEAVNAWLSAYQHKANTYTTYRREATRFLMWCIYQKGRVLAQLKKEDFEDYFIFLQSLPKQWCQTKNTQKTPKNWRPFKGKLSYSAIMTAIRVLNSLINYLVQADYLRTNPIKLIKQFSKLKIDLNGHKYQVWERMLENDEWEAVQAALSEMKEATLKDKDLKMRTQFLFALLYLLGLRIHEVTTHTWSNFRLKNEQWWFFAQGKGDKLGHIPVNEQLLSYIKAYRVYLKKPALPEKTDNEPLILSTRTRRALGVAQLYNLVKNIGKQAAKQFPTQSDKQKKLLALSPHWLRHLAASHQDKAGIPAMMIQNNLRHQSIQTTQIYLHSEDKNRFEAMEKMQMKNAPTTFIETPKYSGFTFTLCLTKGPVNKTMGVSRLLVGVENQIFKDFEFERVGGQTLLHEINRKPLHQAIEITYNVYSKDVIDAPQIWREALQRQAEIWLFDCKIDMEGIEA